MNIYYSIITFIYGTILGSFYNVVGDRLPNNQSIVKPRSHCPKCGHILTPLELIPILSYIFQGGKCKNCKCNIPIIHPLYELFCGIVFLLTYLSFGFTTQFIIAITFISILLILIVSDINYLIIPDEVLIVGCVLLFIETIIFNGFNYFVLHFLYGIIAFVVMFIIKLSGDYLFKKESMGGGDIKLLFVFGFTLGWEMALLTIFLGSIIGLPISLIILLKKKTNIIPFGPFLSLGAMIILLTHYNLDLLLKLLI